MLIDEGCLNDNVLCIIQRYVIMHEQSLVILLKEHDLLYLFALTYIVSTFIIQMNNLKSFLVRFRLNYMSVNVLNIYFTNVKHYV